MGHIVISFGHLLKWLVAMVILQRPKTELLLNLLNHKTIVSFTKLFWSLENKFTFPKFWEIENSRLQIFE